MPDFKVKPSTCKQAISDVQWTQEPTKIAYNFNIYNFILLIYTFIVNL